MKLWNTVQPNLDKNFFVVWCVFYKGIYNDICQSAENYWNGYPRLTMAAAFHLLRPFRLVRMGWEARIWPSNSELRPQFCSLNWQGSIVHVQVFISDFPIDFASLTIPGGRWWFHSLSYLKGPWWQYPLCAWLLSHWSCTITLWAQLFLKDVPCFPPSQDDPQNDYPRVN